ncbi:ATP-binding protein [Streptomyces qinzhouensis]|uniref:ATP-binding protein n=1 Tax=Streptomyces qinzhouensis TaxID=2599401 RepID=A0A5B8JFN9_9ACTN|nr:ATP-binding protein [Streptomyces qinzhouensis]QDY79104.1 ATP-binding protein [Streptomyces qinzhouensis]
MRSAIHDFEVTFPTEDVQVARIRRLTTQHLEAWGLAPLSDDATLLVSELVTNAIRYGVGPVSLCVHAADELRIEVVDGSPVVPTPRRAGPDDENGRGLDIVAAVAHRWGVSSSGKMTWCSLALPGQGGDSYDQPV